MAGADVFVLKGLELLRCAEFVGLGVGVSVGGLADPAHVERGYHCELGWVLLLGDRQFSMRSSDDRLDEVDANNEMRRLIWKCEIR